MISNNRPLREQREQSSKRFKEVLTKFRIAIENFMDNSGQTAF